MWAQLQQQQPSAGAALGTALYMAAAGTGTERWRDDPMAEVDALLAEVKKVIASGQAFAYLGRKGLGNNPYDLMLVPAAAVRKGRLHDQHYTISEAGVTDFRRIDRYKTEAHFTPLVQWRRECELYRRLMRLPFFNRYDRWRSYGIWHHQLASQKRKRTQAALKETAFVLDPHFSAALLEVARHCDVLRTMRMHELTPSARGASLEAIADAQQRHLSAMSMRLADFKQAVLNAVLRECAAADSSSPMHPGLACTRSRRRLHFPTGAPRRVPTSKPNSTPPQPMISLPRRRSFLSTLSCSSRRSRRWGR